MKQLIEEFKSFILKGNVIMLAVAFVMGVAFSKVVEAIVGGLINPLVNAIGGNSAIPLHIGILNIGVVLTAVINFLATAFAVFFLVVKPINKLTELAKKPADPNAPVTPLPATLDDVVAELKSLRESLKK